jgi:hypothetical protein
MGGAAAGGFSGGGEIFEKPALMQGVQCAPRYNIGQIPNA